MRLKQPAKPSPEEGAEMQRQEWNRVSWKHMPGVKDKAMKKTGQVYAAWNWVSGWPWLRMGKGRRCLLYDQSDLPSTSSGFILRSQAATGVALLFSKGKGKGKIRVVSLSLKITRQLYESCILTSHWPDPTIELWMYSVGWKPGFYFTMESWWLQFI